MTRWIDPNTFDLVTRSANGKITSTSNPQKIVKYIKGLK